MRTLSALAGVALLLVGCRPHAPSKAAAKPPERTLVRGYLKGQTHVHSSNSGDSRTAPADVVRWYESHGYDFIVFTDHNYITQVASTARMLVIPGVELTQNLADCAPPPEPGLQCLLHVNTLFAQPAPVAWPPLHGANRLEIYSRSIEMARRLGGLAQLNHPNFHYAADAALLATLARRGLRHFEVANEAVDSNNGGDATHPSTEALWDAALAAAEGAPLYGMATDDAHHYYDAEAVRASEQTAFVGDRGFIMVRAEKNPAAIRQAVERGDFYASSGVLLSRAEVVDGALTVEVAAPRSGRYEITFIGTAGKVLAKQTTDAARFPLANAPAGWLRAVITDEKNRKAWVQPVPVPAHS